MAAGYRSKGTQCYRGDLIRILAGSEKDDLPNSIIQPMGFSRSDTESECEQDITDLMLDAPSAGYKSDKTTADEECSTQRDKKEGYNWSFLALDSIEHYRDQADTPEDRVNQLLGTEELTEDDKTINPDAKPISFQPIFHKNRQRDFIRRFLTHELGKRLDIKKLTRQISQCEPIVTLPYQRHKVPAGRLYVLADTSNRLMSHHYDAGFICADIIKIMGVTGLEIREFKEAPGDSYSLWPLGKSSDESDLHKKQWKPLDCTAEVLILSDMGQLTNENSTIRQSWLVFLQHLYQQSIKPIALSPVPQSYQCLKLKCLVRQVLWKSNGPLTINPLLTKKDNTDQDVNRVLALLSITTHIEPELLRETIQLLGLESGIEVLVSNHPDVQWGYTAIAIKADKKESYQKAFVSESLATQRKIIHCIRKHHSNQFKGVWAEELINLNSIEGIDSSEWQDEIDLAKGFMKRLAKTTYTNQNQTLTSYGHRHLARISRQSKTDNKDYTSVIYGVIEQDNIKAGKPIPSEYSIDIIQSLTAKESDTYHLEIWLLGTEVWLRQKGYTNQVASNLTRGVCLDEFDCNQSQLRYESSDNRFFIGLASLTEYKLPVIEGDYGLQDFQLDTGVEKRLFSKIEKPSWAYQIKYHNHSLKAELALNGTDFVMVYEASGIKAGNPQRSEPENPVSKSSLEATESDSVLEPDVAVIGKAVIGKAAIGSAISANIVVGDAVATSKAVAHATVKSPAMWRQDLISEQLLNDTVSLNTDQYGLYADITLLGIPQRFRYIEPATFLMGSPEEEAERSDNETQHQVTLTQGYWLADTCVTQALWQAVMGDNPSEFKGEKHPVDNVSWIDCWQFIEKLKQHYPALKLTLPTEAQWEYACRAGTTTPFSFGDQINSEQVNFYGDHPYNKGEKSEVRGGTVPVKSLPANPWGLYEMHGNLDEWCQDKGLRDYEGDVIDPGQQDLQDPDKGSEDDGMHPLRGGSWISDGLYCRSANRYGYVAVTRSQFIGFRLSLGPELQRGGTDSLPQAGARTGEQRGAASQSDAPRSGKNLDIFDSLKNILGMESKGVLSTDNQASVLQKPRNLFKRKKK